MERLKLESTIDKLTKNLEINLEKKQEVIEKYLSMSDAEIIKDLSFLAYKTFSFNEEYFDYVLRLIRELNPNICPEI